VCKKERKKMGRKSKDKETEDKKTPLWAAIYARVSSPNQANGYSLDEQVRICRERCNIMGWKVRYIFKENGVSGSTTDRPKFQLMLERAKEGAFDVLVFWKLDRFCRSLLDVINTEKKLKEHRVSLHSVTEQIDTTSSVGRFNFRSVASAAELERDLIKERSRMGMKALAMQHKWPNRLPPLGYKKKGDGYLEVDQEKAKLVRKIFRMYLKLKSMPQVAFELNKKGIKTERGNKWSTPAVKKVLDNELYIGKYEVAGVKDCLRECKIISKNLFEDARKLRQRAKKVRQEMPKNRKQGTIERIFKEYMELLEKEEKDSYRIIT
jgi:site-specific DNA recombinase